jgi:hypothetical protein
LHDLRDLDSRGLPGVDVLTTVFKEGFEAQCQSLGFAGAAVYVAHPVQNRTTAELRRLADESFAEILAMIATK